jgi:hypothetical protein
MRPGPTKRQKIYDKYNGRCSYCGEPSAIFTLDHINPEAKGGTWGIKNLNPACYDCNQSKRDLSLESFRKEIAARLDPNYAPKLTYKSRRRMERHPELTIEPAQPSHWLKTLKRFETPVIFYFEVHESESNQKKVHLAAVMALLAPRSDSKPVYYSMGGFGCLDERPSL